MRTSPIFEPYHVVTVPFPYADRDQREIRPAMVLAVVGEPLPHRLLWLLMITSARHQPWPLDVTIADLDTAGLPRPSVVRPTKVATIDARLCVPRGRLTRPTVAAVLASLRQIGGEPWSLLSD